MARGIIASFLGMFVMACSGCGGSGGGSSSPVQAAASAPASAPLAVLPRVTTPEAVYRAIAQATLLPSATDVQIATREVSVKQFIASNGGDAIYLGYLKTFGVQADPKITSVAVTTGLSDQRLGHYYLHPPLTSGPNIVASACNAPTISRGPTQKAKCALDEWSAYLATGDTSYRDEFLTWANYFVQLSNNGKIQWETDWPPLGIKAPWISGVTQSLVLSVLLRAYQVTSDATYLSTAKQVYYWLTVPISQGGIQLVVKGGAWLEEYPNLSNPSRVMNGHVWALFGIWDYYRVTQDSSALVLFQSGIAALKVQIPAWYDLGYWNVYSHLNRLDTVDGGYMQFIVQQMYALNGITGDSFFTKLGDKWKTAQRTDALFAHNMEKAFLAASPSQPQN